METGLGSRQLADCMGRSPSTFVRCWRHGGRLGGVGADPVNVAVEGQWFAERPWSKTGFLSCGAAAGDVAGFQYWAFPRPLALPLRFFPLGCVLQ